MGDDSTNRSNAALDANKLMEPVPVSAVDAMLGKRVDKPLSLNKARRWELLGALANEAGERRVVKATPNTPYADPRWSRPDGSKNCPLDQHVLSLPAVGLLIPNKADVLRAVAQHNSRLDDPQVSHLILNLVGVNMGGGLVGGCLHCCCLLERGLTVSVPRI